MTIVGFHASHEQAHPADLLQAVRRAEEVGFDALQIHHVGDDQPDFLEVFGAKVIPERRAAS